MGRGRERKQEQSGQESRDVSTLAQHLNRDSVLRRLWDNEQDAVYDRLYVVRRRLPSGLR